MGKTLISFLLVALSWVVASAQSGRFDLEIRLHNMRPDYVLNIGLMTSDKTWSDKVSIKRIDSINYEVSGWLPYPLAARIEIKGRKASRYFYITKGKQFIDVQYDSLHLPLSIKGSLVNEELLTKFIGFMMPVKVADDNWWEEYSALKKRMGDVLPQGTEDSIRKRKAEIDNLRDSLLLQYCRLNPGSYVAFWKLYDYFRYYGYSVLYEESLNKLNSEIQNGLDGRFLRNKLIACKALSAGSVFPDFVLTDTLRNTVHISTDIRKARFTLIDFWYSHCTPCIAQFQDFANIYEEYEDKGFDIIGVSTDLAAEENEWRKVIFRHKIPWKSYWTKDGAYAKEYFIEAFPTNFLVDQVGRILYRDISIPELKIFLSKNLQ
ncbi:MAG TPA: TlpA disulfide reductase family protein [Chitinophagaceae bacterium]|nr:TlpA disulfide reductase family protein [Chitinophagaceae bacterium]